MCKDTAYTEAVCKVYHTLNFVEGKCKGLSGQTDRWMGGQTNWQTEREHNFIHALWPWPQRCWATCLDHGQQLCVVSSKSYHKFWQCVHYDLDLGSRSWHDHRICTTIVWSFIPISSYLLHNIWGYLHTDQLTDLCAQSNIPFLFQKGHTKLWPYTH